MHAPAPSGIHVPPGTWLPEPRMSAREWYEGYWAAIEAAMSHGGAVGESLCKPALTSDESSIDIAFSVARDKPEDLEKLLRLAALAGQAYRQVHGELPE